MTADKTKISISDIATRFRVSVTTISFILNGKGKEKKISSSLIRRVEDYIKKVGYVPSSSKRRLQGGDAGAIVAVLFDDLVSFSLVRELRLALERRSKSVLLVSVSPDQEEEAVLKVLLEAGVGVFVSLVGLSESLLDKLKKNDKVVVLLCEESKNYDSISLNYKEASYQVVQALFTSQSKRIGLVTSVSLQHAYKSILSGYMQAVDEFGGDLSIKKINFQSGDDELLSQITSFIDGNDLDAVFFANEELAFFAASVLKSMEHVRVASFGGFQRLSYLLNTPILASVDEKVLASKLIGLLFDRLAQKTRDFVSEKMLFELTNV